MRTGVGIRNNRRSVAGNDAPVKVRCMVLFLLEDFVGTLGCRMTGAAGGHGKIHGDGVVDKEKTTLLAQRDLDGFVRLAGFGDQFLVAVDFFAPTGLRAKGGMLLFGEDHQRIGASRLKTLENGAALQ